MSGKNEKKVKNLIAKDGLQPYDILPNYDCQLAVLLLKAAKANGAPINSETINNLEKDIFRKVAS